MRDEIEEIIELDEVDGISIFDPDYLQNLELSFYAIGLAGGLKDNSVSSGLMQVIATRIALDINHFRLMLGETK